MTQKELKTQLSYDKDTGIFRWKVLKRGVTRNGVAGALQHDGYRRIRIHRKTYPAHWIAWLYVYGEFPKNEMDHINHIKDDNRISNLRSVTRGENQKNRSLAKNNTSGVAGVCWSKPSKKWSVSIRVCGVLKSLGLFEDIKEAKKVREKAKIEYGYHPNHA